MARVLTLPRQWLGIGDLVSGGREVNKRNSMKKGNNDIETLLNSTVA